MVAADTNGTVQSINVGKADDVTPIYYELETQDLEFGDRTHLKEITDKIVIFSDFGIDSSLAIKSNDGDYKPIDIELDNRVNIGQDIRSVGFFFNIKWSGTAKENSPLFEGLYLEKITDKGITYE